MLAHDFNTEVVTQPATSTINEQYQNTQPAQLINILLVDGLKNSAPKIYEILMNSARLLEPM